MTEDRRSVTTVVTDCIVSNTAAFETKLKFLRSQFSNKLAHLRSQFSDWMNEEHKFNEAAATQGLWDCLTVILISFVTILVTIMAGCSGPTTGDDPDTGANVQADAGQQVDTGVNIPPDAGVADGGGYGPEWNNLLLILPGQYNDQINGHVSTPRVPSNDNPTAVGCQGMLIDNMGGVPLCIDNSDTMTLSLCKGDAKTSPGCSGPLDGNTSVDQGQLWLCDCGVLSAKYGSQIETWCQAKNHPQTNCGPGGVRFDYIFLHNGSWPTDFRKQ